MREETLEALCPAQLHAWRERLTPEAQALANSLPVEHPVDLAAIVTGIDLHEAKKLHEKAQQVSAAAADLTIQFYVPAPAPNPPMLS